MRRHSRASEHCFNKSTQSIDAVVEASSNSYGLGTDGTLPRYRSPCTFVSHKLSFVNMSTAQHDVPHARETVTAQI